MDNWRTINALVKDPVFGKEASLPDALDWLDRTITGLMTLSGFALDGMTRDDGWRFLSIGRRLERLAFQCLALQIAFQHGRAYGLTWLLRLADSIVTYRSRYMARPEWLPVLDLLVLDAANPRSVRYQANGVYSYLKKMEDTYGSCGSELLRPCIEALDGLDPARDLQPENVALRDTVDLLRSTAFALSDRLSHRFFNHAQTNVWASAGQVGAPWADMPGIALRTRPRYVYSAKVTSAHQLAHLKPRNTPWQRVKSHTLDIEPIPIRARRRHSTISAMTSCGS